MRRVVRGVMTLLDRRVLLYVLQPFIYPFLLRVYVDLPSSLISIRVSLAGYHRGPGIWVEEELSWTRPRADHPRTSSLGRLGLR